jgi:Leucine-rich repeat (LRR) protein
MNSILLAAMFVPLASGQPATISVSDRSEPVCVALEGALKKNRNDITSPDLEKVTELKLPHIHIKSFKEHDFAGLTNLKKLHFFSLLHNQGRPNDPIAIDGKVFANLSKLEELIMTEQLGQLPDDVFTGLKSLKTLDLSWGTLNRLPKSMLTLPNIETVYFDGRGMSKDDYETLKTSLGAKLKARREKK